MRRRILFLHYGRNWIRGTEICLLNLLRHIDRTTWEPIFACPGEILRREVALLGVPAYAIDIPEITLDGRRSKFQLLRYAKSLAALSSLLQRQPVDVIYSNSGLPAQLGYPLSRAFGIPLVCHIHAQHPKRYPWMWLFKFADKILCCSRHVEASLTRKVRFSGDVKVIYNRIDQRRFVPCPGSSALRAELGLDERHVVVGQAGSLIQRKGADLLIRAVGFLAKAHHELRLVFVGDGEERERVRALVGEFGLSGHVVFVGETNDPQPYYSQVFDINVLASRAEGFPLCLLEGASCALPSVASRCGGIPEEVEDGVTGLLFERGSVDDLVTKLALPVRSPQLRRQMGARGRERVEQQFSLDRYVNAMQNELRLLLPASPVAR